MTIILLWRLKNGVPQGSVFDLFYLTSIGLLYDLPDTISRTYAYADDLAIKHSARDRFLLEETLT